MEGPVSEKVEWLRRAAADGEIHTVRLSFGDHLGAWRGKRIPVAHFLERHLDQPMGFCDGMIVCDVQCEIIQETPFTNFGTGYPDFHVWPDLGHLRAAAWAPGEALVFGAPADHHGVPFATGPGRVLEIVTTRLADRGVQAMVRGTLGGRFMLDPRRGAPWGEGGLTPAEPVVPLDRVMRGLLRSGLPVSGVQVGPAPGEFEIGFASSEPREIAESILIAKGACKEVGAEADVRATFMTRTVGGSRASVQTFDVRFDGAGFRDLEPAAIQQLLHQARGLFQPSLTAFKAGPPPAPSVEAADDAATVRGLVASSEGDPFVAIAANLAAVCSAAEAALSPGVSAPTSLLDAARALRNAGWVTEWLGPDYIENTIPLLEHEGALFDEVVSDWELDRYWGAS